MTTKVSHHYLFARNSYQLQRCIYILEIVDVESQTVVCVEVLQLNIVQCDQWTPISCFFDRRDDPMFSRMYLTEIQRKHEQHV